MNEKTAHVREVMTREDPEAIRKSVDDLNQVLQQVGAAAYQQPGPQQEAPSGEGPSEPGPQEGEDVVDGEYHSA